MPDGASAPLAQGLPLYAALACYLAALVATCIRPRIGGWLIRAGVVFHLSAVIGRGWAIGFFPLTNKMESFSAASLAIALVAVSTWREVRLYVVPLLALGCAALLTALRFPLEITYPPPLMRTLWYPLHVPLSFLAYGAWAAAAAAALVWLRQRDPAWLERVDDLALKGFVLWSLSMICGGLWGVLAWGAYFMWDVKIIWSVILWLIVAYVGTSFFFGRSSHAF
jgi:ABC-type transport system involved in cytochrome c biogenesis permease subunit